MVSVWLNCMTCKSDMKGLKRDKTMNKMRKMDKDKTLSDDSKDLIDKARKHILYSLQDIIVPTGAGQEASEEVPKMGIASTEPKPTEGTITDFRSTLEMLFGEINKDKFDFLVPEVFEGPTDTSKNIFNVRDSVDNMFSDKDSFGKIFNDKDLVKNTFNQKKTYYMGLSMSNDKDSVENTFDDDDSIDNKFNYKDSFEKISNAKDSFEKISNAKDSVKKMFNDKDCVEKMFNEKDSVEKMFNVKDSVEKMLNDKDSVNKMFNVQYDKLLPHSAKPKTCC